MIVIRFEEGTNPAELLDIFAAECNLSRVVVGKLIACAGTADCIEGNLLVCL